MLNKDIQLCAIGNAIVDIQFEATDKEIRELTFEKGTMTLVDAQKHEEIADKMNNRNKYFCSGGSAANSVIAFSSFGGKSAYKCLLGDDSNGKFYRDEMANLGLILSTENIPNKSTGVCYVLISPDTERTLATSLGANTLFSPKNINNEIIKRSEWLYLEGYKITEDSGYESLLYAISIAKKYDTKIALTFSDKFIVDFFKDRVDNILESVDLFFCNQLEAQSFTKTKSNDNAFKELKKLEKNFVMTEHDKGSRIFWNKKTYEIPAYDATPVDSTGAGDMYAGGFMYGLIHGKSLSRAGHLGSLAAARVVSQHGARLKESHTELKKQIFEEIN